MGEDSLSKLGGHHHGHQKKPFRHLVALEKYPSFLFWPMLLAVLSAQGITVVDFTTQVPLYLRDHPSRVGSDAVLEGQEIATAEALTSAPRERELADFALKMLYVAESGNIFDVVDGRAVYLEAIQEVENAVMEATGYSLYCALEYEDDGTSACARPLSVLNYFDPMYFAPVDGNYDSLDDGPLCTLDTTKSPPLCDMGQPLKLGNSAKMGASLVTQPSAIMENVDLTQANVDSTVAYWRGYDEHPFAYLAPQGAGFTQLTLGNMMRMVTASEFPAAGPAAVRSEFYFGIPRPGYNDTTNGDSLKEQGDDIGQFLLDTVAELLEERRDSEAGRLDILWDNRNLRDLFLQSQLSSDGQLVAGSIIFVFAYMWLQTKSAFLAFFGVGMVFLNFMPSIFINRFVFGFSYFGTLNMLAIFIILGIGADDIFVLLDTWAHTCLDHPHDSVAQQMSDTLRHAGKAMATTSASTIFAFIANSTSSFPAVYTFGVWCATLVFVNFCAVCLFYPAVVVVHHTYLEGKGCCPLCSRKPAADAVSEVGGGGADTMAAASPPDPEGAGMGAAAGAASEAKADGGIIADSDSPGTDPDIMVKGVNKEEGKMEKFFGDTLYPKVIHPHNKVVLLFFAALSIFYLAFAVQVEPDPNPPELFPSGNNYVEYQPTLASHFSGSNNPYRVTARLVFGIDSLDRTGTDPTDQLDRGVVSFDEDFMTPGSFGESADWLLQLCNNAAADKTAGQRRVYPADENVPYPVMCWVQSLHAHVQRNASLSWPIPEGQVFNVIRAWIQSLSQPGDPGYQPGVTNYAIWKPMLYAEGLENSFKYRFCIIEIALTIETTSSFNEGIDTYDAWVNWLNAQLLTAPPGMTTGFVTDVGRFHYYALQRTILREAIGGILLSLLFAFIILTLATNNYIIAVYAVGTIAALVIAVIAFTVMMGWKLGLIESIIYVMVVGLSVDYTVHLSDAYLENKETKRGPRTREMLRMMGVSIVSGAFSTLGACMFLLPAFVAFFVKFGSVIAFLISMSLVFSLLGYAALLDLFGPEDDKGTLSFSSNTCMARVYEDFTRWLNNDAAAEREAMEDKLDRMHEEILALRTTLASSGGAAGEETRGLIAADTRDVSV